MTSVHSRVVILTNIPTPYRNPVFEHLPQDRFVVVFCARSESNRQWDLGEPNFVHEFLTPRARALDDGFNYVHDNPGVFAALDRLRPGLVVTGGFNPTHLRAFAWTRLRRTVHACMTDGTLASEAHLGWRHRVARRVVFAGSRSFIAASQGGVDLYRAYGIATEHIFRSPLCADNSRFAAHARPSSQRDIDVLFVGQLHERKMPLFFAEVCGALVRRRGYCRAAVVGSGPLHAPTLTALTAAGVEVLDPGFVQPDALPAWYGRARLLLFPTRLDPWGMVANEALAAGTPVITTPQAGAAGDLVEPGRNGEVAPPDVLQWVELAADLLEDNDRWQRMSDAALESIREITFDTAARALVQACDHAMGRQA